MKPLHRLILVFAASGLIAPLASGQQAILDKTTLGSSQNDARDLANSLVVPNRVHLGKEKKEEVDPKKLPSKSVKDPKFEGSLLSMGLGSAEDPNSHQEKVRGASDKDSTPSKQADAGGGEKDSKVSQQADTSGDKERASKSTDAHGDGQNKDQKATSAAADEKSSEKEKAAANKSDGDR